MSPCTQPLRIFVGKLAAILDTERAEPAILGRAAEALRDLIRTDVWLPAHLAEPDPLKYRQYLLYCDARERFSVVSFVWGPGQSTPIHNHTVWGLVGILRGAESSQRYRRNEHGNLVPDGALEYLTPGTVDAVSPTIGDIHQVANAFGDRASVSIHVYGANIGAVRREAFELPGRSKPFVSGYSNREIPPNIWDGWNGPLAAGPAATP